MALVTNQAMRKCGLRYATKDEAENSKRGRTGRYRLVECHWCDGFHLVLPRQAKAPKKTLAVAGAPKASDAEFSRAVRALIRKRAGNGDPGEACCEACSRWLGLRGGQIQHIQARGEGGSRDPLLGTPVNGALLCGTPQSLCHGACEARDLKYYRAGFWIWKWEAVGSRQLYVGFAAPGHTGTPWWLLPDGTYGEEDPAFRADPDPASKFWDQAGAA